jgi:hypothetical protein
VSSSTASGVPSAGRRRPLTRSRTGRAPDGNPGRGLDVERETIDGREYVVLKIPPPEPRVLSSRVPVIRHARPGLVARVV